MAQRSFVLVLVLALALSASALACSGSPKRSPEGGGAARPSSASPSSTRITAFTVSNENLNVDKIGMRDGALKPDGLRDHVFTATIEGPFDALFIAETNQKGDPVYGFRADSMVGGEGLPRELGGVIDTGKMTIGIGAVLDGSFINAENGSVSAGAGHHEIKLYAPNTNLLVGGDFVRLYARTPEGGVVASPVASY